MGREEKVSIKDVARIAGVSVATVSRVLNGSSVSEELSEKVRRAVQELGYRPNRAAQHLRGGHVQKVGVVMADITNPFFTGILTGIESVLWKANYALLLGHSNEDAERERLHLEALLEEGVAGIILAAVTNNTGRYKSVVQEGIPLLAIDRIPNGLRVDAVTINNVEAAQRATEHLAQLGHKKIGLVGGPEYLTTGHDRQLGYQQGLRAYGIEYDPRYVVNGGFLQLGGYQAMGQLLDLPDPPAAVLVANNVMTMGALQCINERKLEIPGQIALVGFDDVPWASALQSPLTTVAQPTYELGVVAARLLLDRIREPGGPLQRVMLSTELIVRQSCGANRDKA